MSKAKLLIVEDESIIAADLASKLERLGYVITKICAKGEDSISLAKSLRPDIVLMDIRLGGGMDGIEAAGIIRQELDIPVIFLTAHSDSATLSRAKLSEPYGYILKPFQEREVETAIEIALFKHIAESRLRSSETRYRALFNGMSEGFALHEIICSENGDPIDYRFLDVNPAFERLTGLKRENTIGKTAGEILPGLEPEWIEVYGKVALTGDPAHFDRFSSELEKCFEIFAYSPEKNKFATIFVDVTERKQIQKQIEHLASFPQLNPNPIIELDLNGNVIFMNVAAQTILQMQPGKTDPKNLLPPDIDQIIRDMKSEDRKPAIHREIALGDRVFDEVVEYANPLQTIRIYAIDITDRIHAEKAMRESEERFRLLADRIDQVFWFSEVKPERIIFLSPAFERIFGRSIREAYLNVDTWRNMIHPEDRDLDRHLFDQWIENRPENELISHYRILRDDGSIRWIENRSIVIGWQDGEPKSISGIAKDVTERRQAEADLRDMNIILEKRVNERTEQLRAVALELTQAEQRERKRLAAILHDHLQQLLVASKLGILLAQKQTDDEELIQSLDRVSGLLDESITSSKTLAVELSPPVLNEIGMVAAIRWLSRWIKEKHGLDVEVTADTEIPSDPHGICILLFQSIRELLFNVVKHSRAKSAHIQIRQFKDDQIQIIVADEGCGFDPSASIVDGSTGGLGLVSVRERLALVGGSFDICSSCSSGTRVTLTAPLRRPLIDAPEVSRAITMAIKPSQPLPDERRKSSNIRIMVVDDHEIMREGLIQLLKAEPQIEVIGEAADGETAIEMIRQLQPDVAIMDVNLPGISGIEATRRILAEFPDMKIIGLSMYEESLQGDSFLKAGAKKYLHKAGPSHLLIEAVKSIFQANI